MRALVAVNQRCVDLPNCKDNLPARPGCCHLPVAISPLTQPSRLRCGSSAGSLACRRRTA